MAYLGKSPSQGVRSRYYFTATGGETSLSGSDDNSNTLVFSDGEYVDVSLNGVALVAGTDYNTTTANTIGGLSALTASDVVEVIVYDTFSVFSGNVNSDFSVGANLSVTGTTALTGNATAAGNLNVTGNVDVDGTTTVDGLTSSEALDVTTSTHANASVFKSTGTTQLFLQDTDATANDQFWGFQVSGGSLNILTCDDDRSGGFLTPIELTSTGVLSHSISASGDIAKFVTSANSGTGLFLNSQTTNQIDIVGYDGSAANAVNIRAGGASGSGMLIDTSNNIMMGTTSVGGTSILSLGSTNYMVATHNSGGTSGFFGQIRFRNNANSADVGTINRVNDGSVQYNTTSDARLKENIADMVGAIARVKQLAPKRYSWVNEDLDAADQDGFLAHEAQTVVPLAVSGTQNEVDDDGNPIYMQMDYSKLVPLLTGALKEAIAKIETLETKVAALEAAE